MIRPRAQSDRDVAANVLSLVRRPRAQHGCSAGPPHHAFLAPPAVDRGCDCRIGIWRRCRTGGGSGATALADGRRQCRGCADMLVSVRKPASGVAAIIVGVVLLLVGATSVFGELQDTLNRIWKVPVPNKVGSWIKLVRSRLRSFGMVLVMGFLLVVSLLLSAALAVAGR